MIYLQASIAYFTLLFPIIIIYDGLLLNWNPHVFVKVSAPYSMTYNSFSLLAIATMSSTYKSMWIYFLWIVTISHFNRNTMPHYALLTGTTCDSFIQLSRANVLNCT